MSLSAPLITFIIVIYVKFPSIYAHWTNSMEQNLIEKLRVIQLVKQFPAF
jgi:hypothetical protein